MSHRNRITLRPNALPHLPSRGGVIVEAFKTANGPWTLRVLMDACGLFVTVPLDDVVYL